MITCHQLIRAQDHSEHDAEQAIDTITLSETDRHRRRLLMRSDSGIEFLLDLQTVTLLKHHDTLCLSDGRKVRVNAMPEPLYAVYGKDANHLLVLTWHVGNRHLATQIMGDHLRIRCDPVIRTMLEQLGATVEDIQAGFDPEGGAYGDAPAHHHHHD